MMPSPSPRRSHQRLVLAALAAVALATAASAPTVAQQPPPGQAPAARGKAQAAPLPPAPPAPPAMTGVWVDHTGRGAIEIVACEASLCGRIVWMQQPNDKKGQPLRDKLNEDRRLRERLICGLPVIGGLKAMRDGSWDGGWIYDPEQGESFDVELRLLQPDVLQVKGYKGFKFLSETFQWRRATQPLAPACPVVPPA